MKRFFRFVYRLLKIAAVVAALILLGVLLMQQTTLTEQVGALSTRMHELEQAGPARPAPGSQAPAPTATPTSPPTADATDTPTPAPSRTPTRTPTAANTGPQAGATPARTQAATNTSTPAPTSTSTRPPTATSTPAPTSTATRPPTATSTPVPAPHFIVNSDHVNVRRGPDPAFSIIGTVARGQQFDIGARNNSGTWLEFCCVNDERGWIYAPLLILSVDVSAIPIAQNIPAVPTATNTPVPPTATPVPPTNTPAPQPPSSGGGSGGGNDLEGITIAPENRCSPYNADDYSYPQSVEPQIVAQQGGRIYGPYTGTYFASTGMQFTDAGATPTSTMQSGHGNNALELYDDNGNGRITCAEARRHGIAPVPRGHPAYQYMNDRDNNGVVCE